MHVFEYMTRNVHCLAPECTLAEAVKQMVERRITGCPVVSPKGELEGLISLSDIAVDGVTQPQGHAERQVREIMQRRIYRIDEAALINSAILQFQEHRVHRLVVVTPQGRVAGMLSSLDLLKAVLDKFGYPPPVL